MASSAGVRPGRGTTWRSRHVAENRTVPPLVANRLYLAAAILIALGLLCFPLVLSGVLSHSGVADLDRPVELWINTQRNPFSTPVMIIMTVAFGPVVLPVIILMAVLVWSVAAKHVWRPLILGAAMVTGVIIANTIAFIIQRQRPPTSLMLIGNDTTFSFPSGHILGASDFLVITAFLLVSRSPTIGRALTALAIAWIGIFAEIYSRLYLGYHWLTDGLASLSISIVIVGVVIAVDTRHRSRAGARHSREVGGSGGPTVPPSQRR